MRLFDIKKGSKCIYIEYTGRSGQIEKRLNGLGFLKGNLLKVENRNIFGDATVILLGRTVAIESSLQREITVKEVEWNYIVRNA